MMAVTRSCFFLVLLLTNGLSASFGLQSVYKIPCKSILSDCEESLKAIESNLTVGEDVRIDIEETHLYLKEAVTFAGLGSLTINGKPDSKSTINCTLTGNSTGLLLENITRLNMNNLVLTLCGAMIRIGKKTFMSAVTLKNCNDVNITNMTIKNSLGTGLTIHQQNQGRVSIVRSNFTDNQLSAEMKDGDVRGGGGIYIGDFQGNLNSSITFEFEHCYFERNVAHNNEYNSYYTNEFGEKRSGFGNGGGVNVAIKSYDMIQSSLKFSFSECTYSENEAFLGGGLAIHVSSKTVFSNMANLNILVSNSTFSHNGRAKDSQHHKTRIGGGVHLNYGFAQTGSISNSETKFINVNFKNNYAEIGGGVFGFSTRHNTADNSLLFDNCIFENNKAHTGSAVDLTPSSFVKTSDGHTIPTVFRNCHFVDNSVFVNTLGTDDSQSTAGIGTLYATEYEIKFEGETQFVNNIGTALHLVNSVANFSASDANFTRNRGLRGGAIALIGTSIMILGPNKEYTFRDNNASYQGGAIFVMMASNHDFTISRSCFLQFFNGSQLVQTKLWNTTVNFDGNHAPVGSTIFATSLHSCLIINNASSETNAYYITVKESEVFSIRGIDINNSEIVTEGAQFHREHSELHVIPGKLYNHGVTIMDDMKNVVKEPLRVEIMKNNTSVELDSDTFLYVGDKIKVKGVEGDVANIYLQTVSTRQSSITLNMKIEECPPGYEPENRKCICKSKDYYGLLECDDNNFQSILKPGLWIGRIKDEVNPGVKELVTSVCPRTFCDYNTYTDDKSILSTIKLPLSYSELERAICGEKRQGVLCGNCSSNFTTHFHSPHFQCKRADPTLCKVGWLFYVLSELVPVTVVFIAVIIFNVNFTSGAVNGFILYSQVLLSLNIDASGIITLLNNGALQGYQFLYGFLNLDFFTIDSLSFCLWPNATALDMLAFKYITIVYALSLVILVIWFMNKCGGRCLGKYCRITAVKCSIIHGISAFFIICYSQTITVSNGLLNGAEFWLKKNSRLTISRRVWHNGNFRYFKTEHLPYALPALLCLLLIGIIPPFLLLVYPLVNKILAFFGIEESKIVNLLSHMLPISSLKPLLDSFQGCFKDNLRFFAGLYFIYRWMGPIVNAVASSLGTAYITSEILLIVMLVLHALFQPYLKRVHNIVDTLLFTNLLLINTITCINYYLYQSQERRHTVIEKVTRIAAFQMILIYLPICIMLLYLLVVGCKKLCNFCTKRKISQRIFENKIDQPVMIRLRDAVQTLSTANVTDADDELPHRLIASEVSYECFEDVDHAREKLTVTKHIKDSITY